MLHLGFIWVGLCYLTVRDLMCLLCLRELFGLVRCFNLMFILCLLTLWDFIFSASEFGFGTVAFGLEFVRGYVYT